jgi:putative transposase
MINANNNLTYGRGYVYRIQYHIVWCVKYRREVLYNDIEKTLFDTIAETASECGFQVDTMECMPDHVHLLISCTPQHFIPTIIKILKGNTARRLFIKHPELKAKLWDGHLWNPSYFVATISENTTKQIEEYINNQKIK